MGSQPKGKTTKMEDDQNGRRPKWKTTKIEDDQNGRRPKWKTTFDGRQPSMEDDLQWKMTNKGRIIMGEVSLQKSFPIGRHTALDIFRFAVFFSKWLQKCYA